MGYLITATAMVFCVGYIVATGSYFIAASKDYQVMVIEPDDDVLKQLGTIKDGRLSEISGIAQSILYPGKFWVHNDSGNPAELFMIDQQGNVLVRLELKGATNRDWEDLCTFSQNGSPYICVGDVGDNRGRYQNYHLYVLREPKLADLPKQAGGKPSTRNLVVKPFSKIDFTYEDGPKNCEALAYDSSGQSLLLAEKGFDKTKNPKIGIYELKLDFLFDKSSPVQPLIAKRIANGGLRMPTAMAISGDGSRLIISSYAIAGVWDKNNSSNWSTELSKKPLLMPLPVQRQGRSDFAERKRKCGGNNQ